jgi:hypothetical protein
MRNNRCLVSGGALALVLSLSGCLDGTGSLTGTSPDSSRTPQAVERDIEAPQVFSKRDRALWDGRPSLGGVWVAHPDVRTPERVIIRNTETGRETIGALFRRERMNPGPIFQVSADAAAAVGMLAGAPTGIEVIALRTEEVRPAPAAPEPEVPAVAVAETASAPAATATAAAAPAPEAAVAATPAATAQVETAGAVASASETMIALPDAEPAARPTGFFGRLFGRRTASEETAEVAAIETQPLADAPATAAPVGPDAPLRMPTPLGVQPDAPAAAPASAASPLAKPFIQLGIFSVEANANRAQSLARNAGLSARVIKGQTQGNNFWRVTVGPATTSAEQGDLLKRVKGLGFNDAYSVRR